MCFICTVETIEETKKREGGKIPKKTIEIGNDICMPNRNLLNHLLMNSLSIKID